MKLLNKAAILGVEDLKHEDVPVPQWGGTVRVRMMTGAERDEFRSAIANEEGKSSPGQVSAALLVATCIDETGARLFSAEDIDALKEKSAAALDVLAEASMRLNGLGGNAVSDAGKNSASGQSDDSGSASLSPSEKQ